MADIEPRIKSECALQSVPAIDNIASKFGHRHQVSHGWHTHALASYLTLADECNAMLCYAMPCPGLVWCGLV